ncbi:HbrB-like-domain-containing protein [Trametes meyenii]|nr:HbrB-like-domain-containing protein [Trametes meyenii]
MHRLGTLAHLPALAAPPTALALSLAAQMTAPPGIGGSSGGGAGGSAGSSVGHAVLSSAMSAESPWTSLHVLVLPLFNDEPLRVPIEDLNQLVKRHIQTVVSAAPGKAVATLEHDTYELIAAGMVTLNSKLAGVDDDKLVSRVVEVWSSFWTQVLPYLEGALLPLQTDQILSALYRLPKAHRPASPTATQNGKGASASAGLLLQSTTSPIDVRALALVSFRDRVVLPLFPRLYARLTMSKDENPASTEPHQARLQQMLLVLVSQRSHRLVSLSLTMPPPQPTAGEAALARLLRALHAPLTTRPARPTTGAPSFLSAGLPRDRRGRIAHRAERSHAHAHSHSYAPTQTQAHGGRVSGAELDARGRWRLREEAGEFEEGNDEDEDYDEGGGRGADGYWYEGETDTPRVGVSFADPVRERDKEFLESLRSPDPENSTRMSMGGWGLPGAGREGEGEDVYADVEEDEEDDEKEEEGEDEAMDWDAAQVGRSASGSGRWRRGMVLTGDGQAVVERMVGMKAEPASAPTHQQLPPQLQPQPQPQPQQQTQAPLQQPDPRRRMI